jgi:hypothetical protein
VGWGRMDATCEAVQGERQLQHLHVLAAASSTHEFARVCLSFARVTPNKASLLHTQHAYRTVCLSSVGEGERVKPP